MLTRISALAVALTVSGIAQAQGLHAVSPLPGYSCMRLNVPAGYLYDHRDAGVPEYASPALTARVLSRAPSVAIVRDGPATATGFRAVIRPDKTIGWVEARYLVPWTNPYAPAAKCVPSVMSNGSIGMSGH